jgi:hypothetical protein
MVVVSGTVMLTPVISACTRIEAVLTTPAPTATSVPLAPTSTFAPNPTATITPNPTATVTPNPTPTQQPQPVSALAKIALVKIGDRATGVRRAIELLGINSIRGNQVLLKPNLNSADAAPGSTHPDVLRMLVTELYNMGAQTITLADRSGMGDTRTVMQQTGVLDLAQNLGSRRSYSTICRKAIGLFSNRQTFTGRAATPCLSCCWKLNASCRRVI